MKSYHTILVFVLLIGSAVFASIRSYHHAERDIIHDMNQALALTLQQKQEGWITPDTIRHYRSHLKIEALRWQSIVYYALDDRRGGLASRRMQWRGKARTLEFQGYANCSMASVLALSDQRLPLALTLAALLWMAASMHHLRQRRQGMIVVGGMMMDETQTRFYDLSRQPVALTPMQQQLMAMFFRAEDHRLSKQEICDALWPRKPDASETLYTLVRRLKPVVEAHGGMRIVSDRGKDYRLQED